MIGNASRSTLPVGHWRAVKTTGTILIDEFSEDVGQLLRGSGFETTRMSEYLSPQFRTKNAELLAKKVLVCVVLVAWKLEQFESWPLACVGEQLALRALRCACYAP